MKSLRERGINDLVIGIESADDDVLQMVNKGYDSEDILTQCKNHKLLV